MFIAPIALSLIYYKESPGPVLRINQEMTRNARYFGQSFASLIERGLGDIHENTIKLSRPERFVRPEEIDDYNLDLKVEEIVLALGGDEFKAKNRISYKREIYSEGDAMFSYGPLSLRALYSRERVVLGNEISVERWVDAEKTLAVYDSCDLGISATAGRVLSVGKNCRFTRLYAPVIYLGQYPDRLKNPMDDKDEGILKLPVRRKWKRINNITWEYAGPKKRVEFTVVSRQDVKLLEGVILQGDIRSNGCVRICDGAVVLGSVIAEGNIDIGSDALILGHVFTQGSIRIGERCVFGQQGGITSVIARGDISIGEGCMAFGYISCEGEGYIARGDFGYKKFAIEPRRFKYLEWEGDGLNVSFPDLETYEELDPMAYRKNEFVITAELPYGAKSISGSFFFACENLRKVSLPLSLEEIGDFSMADCPKLELIEGLEESNVKTVGLSAFENCSRIAVLEFPDTVEKLGGACCAGMKNLKKISFGEESRLREIGDHAFRDCASLEEIFIPDGVKKIGVSAFSGCENLKKISIPSGCEEQPGIAAVADNVALDIRPVTDDDFTTDTGSEAADV